MREACYTARRKSILHKHCERYSRDARYNDLRFATKCGLLTALVFGAKAQTAAPKIVPETVGHVRNMSIPSPGDRARLRGTITAFSGWHNSFFLQDGGAAISVDRRESAPAKVGDKVEVTGQVQPGLFANVFVSEKTRILTSGA